MSSPLRNENLRPVGSVARIFFKKLGPFRATNSAVLSQMTRLSGGGTMTPTTAPCTAPSSS